MQTMAPVPAPKSKGNAMRYNPSATYTMGAAMPTMRGQRSLCAQALAYSLANPVPGQPLHATMGVWCANNPACAGLANGAGARTVGWWSGRCAGFAGFAVVSGWLVPAGVVAAA